MRLLRALGMADGDQRLFEQLLEIRLPDVDDVVDVGRATKQRVIAATVCGGRRPERPVRSIDKDAVVKVAAK